MQRYPAARDMSWYLSNLDDTPVRVTVEWSDDSGPRFLADVTERYWSELAFYLRPAVANGAPPSILMTWWAVLFALSHLARYAPAVWIQTINPDISPLTVPIEEGLRLAKRGLPRLVFHAVTGSWGP